MTDNPTKNPFAFKGGDRTQLLCMTQLRQIRTVRMLVIWVFRNKLARENTSRCSLNLYVPRQYRCHIPAAPLCMEVSGAGLSPIAVVKTKGKWERLPQLLKTPGLLGKPTLIPPIVARKMTLWPVQISNSRILELAFLLS